MFGLRLMTVIIVMIWSILACVAGGIVGARELKSFGGGAVRSEQRSREENGEPKLSFARAYNTASYAG